MAIIHFQFESIHPFYDGNGRTGRIINVLYLVQKELLDIPVLYLSRHIVENKSMYYKLLQDVRESGNWEQWILYMLDGVEKTSQKTIQIVQAIDKAVWSYKQQIRDNFRFYSQDLINPTTSLQKLIPIFERFFFGVTDTHVDFVSVPRLSA